MVAAASPIFSVESRKGITDGYAQGMPGRNGQENGRLPWTLKTTGW